MQQLFTTVRYLSRRFHARWSAIDDALTLIRSSSGAATSEGERARRMLLNVFRQQTYTDSTREALRTDRANALKQLGQPLAEALGHIVTIELADEMLAALDQAEGERWRERSAAELVERGDTVYAPFIASLRRHGIVRGDHEVLTEREWAVVARYVCRRVEQRVGSLPPIRTDRETRRGGGRRHPFWDPYAAPRR